MPDARHGRKKRKKTRGAASPLPELLQKYQKGRHDTSAYLGAAGSTSCVCVIICVQVFWFRERKKKKEKRPDRGKKKIQMTVWRLEGACVEMKKVDRKQVPACGSL